MEIQLTDQHLFIDFKAAYDSVKRNELWQIMMERGFPAKLIWRIRVDLDGPKSSKLLSFLLADENSSLFVILDGLKQGDALSSLLFNIVLEGAIRRADVQRSGTIVTRSHMLLSFADDIDIMGMDGRAIEVAFIPFKRGTVRAGFIIGNSDEVVLGGEKFDELFILVV